MNKLTNFLSLSLVAFILISCNSPKTETFQLWDKVTLSFEGPQLSENEETFMDYRLDVHFLNPESGAFYNVPGYFAADGDAAETSANSGTYLESEF